MKRRSTTYFLPELGQPMLRVLKIMAPHFKEIREIWKQSMQSLKLGVDAGDVDKLAGITLEAHYATLCAGKMAAYRLALAGCGQSLDRMGVPPVHATIALSLYLESCCALLLNLNIRDNEFTMALVHLNSASQSLIIAGYSKQHSMNCLRLVERERRRLSQDLHDEIGHNLIVLKLYLELIARDYRKGVKEDLIEKLEEAMTLVSQSIKSVRRVILDLGPAVLDQLGLLPSFKVYADQFSARTGIHVDVRGKDIPEIPRVCETALFRVFQGALSNVAKHSRAKRVQIAVRSVKGSIIRMSIEDNGIGFTTTKPRPKRMFGITAMQERINKLGGQFRLKSRPASSKDCRSGTRIEVVLPTTGTVAQVAAHSQ
jgi:signal transduction histidine kinase